MILTKRQIIEMLIKGLELFDDAIRIKFEIRIALKMRTMPENEFLKFIKNDTNWDLEPIRKNTYIVR